MLAGLAVFALLDSQLGVTGWKSLDRSAARNAVFGLEVGVFVVCTASLLVAVGRDLAHVLRGKLRPRRESDLYWRVLYAWVLLGVPLGGEQYEAARGAAHRRKVADVDAEAGAAQVDARCAAHLARPLEQPG